VSYSTSVGSLLAAGGTGSGVHSFRMELLPPPPTPALALNALTIRIINETLIFESILPYTKSIPLEYVNFEILKIFYDTHLCGVVFLASNGVYTR
jgi:hypothetical protein